MECHRDSGSEAEEYPVPMWVSEQQDVRLGLALWELPEGQAEPNGP
jgi:hypothetical protein